MQDHDMATMYMYACIAIQLEILDKEPKTQNIDQKKVDETSD